MIEIDGAAGGGQLLRTAIGLSTLADEPVTVENVRGGRDEPGLRPQHIAAVSTLAEICDAEHSALDEGTETVTFDPGAVRSGGFTVDIGTAGSVTLVFDAVLPLASVLSDAVRLQATGGTHVKWSPSMEHYRRVKLPLLRAHGLQAAVDVDRVGFYPAGGGRATLTLGPSTLSPFALDERGDLEGVCVHSTESASLGDQSVAARQAEAAIDRLTATDLPVRERTQRTVDAASPGSSIAVGLVYENARAGSDELGAPGRPAEAVGEAAASAAIDAHESTAAVDPHLADQLLVPLAIAGGRLRISHLTEHLQTSLDLLEQFGYRIDRQDRDGVVDLVV